MIKNDIYTTLLLIEKYEEYLKKGYSKKTSEKLAKLDLTLKDIKEVKLNN
jgi:signal recognition particle GTPase